LRETVSRLPTRQKTALVLRYMADMTPEEVGEQMGCSAQAVRNLVHELIELEEGEPLVRRVGAGPRSRDQGLLVGGAPREALDEVGDAHPVPPLVRTAVEQGLDIQRDSL
jgi:predicted transcriptional regulator